MTAMTRACMLLLILPCVAGAQEQGCTLNGNPACNTATNLGNLAGDSGNATITRTGSGEAFFHVRVQETSSSMRALTARIHLASPPGTDYDLYLRCAACSGVAVPFTKGGPGGTESGAVTRSDTLTDNSFTLFIEVRHRSGTSCAPWTLTIGGNTATATGALSCG